MRLASRAFCLAVAVTLPCRADEPGFTPLFNGQDLSGWEGDVAGYQVVDGELRSCKGSAGKLRSVESYGDFELRFEFRLTPGANNGLGIRLGQESDTAYSGVELQILDDGHPRYADVLKPWQMHGSIYGVVAAERGCLKPTGEWNTEEVTVRGTRIIVVVNGKTIVDADVAPFRDGQPTPDGKHHPGLSRTSGPLGFLGHGDEVHFRNIRIRTLP